MPHVRVKGVQNTMQFPDEMPLADIRTFLSNRFSDLKRVGEPALAIGSGIIAEPIAGLAGIGSAIVGGDGGQTVRDVQEALTFQPRTPEGQEGLQAVGDSIIGGFGEIIAGAEQKLGDAAFELTDSPAFAAFATTLPSAILEGVGLRSFSKAGKTAAKANIGTLRSGVGPIDNISKLKQAITKEQAIFSPEFTKLQKQFKANPSQKVEILESIRQKRMKLDALNSQLRLAEIRAKPKPAKVPDAPSKPAQKFKGKVFHQTSSDFTKFDPKQGADGTVWFTSDMAEFSKPGSAASAASGKGRVIESNVELNKVAGWDEINKFSIAELVDQGFDGALLDGDIQVFDPAAIKSLKNIDKPLSPIELKDSVLANNPNVKLSLSGRDNTIIIDKIIADKQGTGAGTKALKDIINHADANGKTLALTPSADFGGNKARLTKLYKSLGFVDNKGKNKDFSISETMLREPK